LATQPLYAGHKSRLGRKLVIFLAIVAVSPLVAGTYGAIHNQFSYTVSSEYFTAFKFVQFDLLDSPLPDRVRASIVGFRASWWMGPALGILISLAAFVHREPREMLHAGVRAYAVTIAVTALVGLVALLIGIASTKPLRLEDYAYWYVPSGLLHPRRFLCAGYMHNGAYLGSVVGVVVAWIDNVVGGIRRRRRIREELVRTSSSGSGDEAVLRVRR
jgi:hypothetical protein